MRVNNLFSKLFTLTTTYCLLSTVLAGCGYTTRSMISSKYKTIYVTPFVNKINITNEADTGSKYKVNRPMVETDITSIVIRKFHLDGNLRPSNKEKADLILKGEVIDFRKDPLRYNDNDEVSEYRMNLVVNLSCWSVGEDKLLWEENGFTGYTEYYTSAYPLSNVTKKTDDQAITDALDDLGRRVVERFVNEW